MHQYVRETALYFPAQGLTAPVALGIDLEQVVSAVAARLGAGMRLEQDDVQGVQCIAVGDKVCAPDVAEMLMDEAAGSFSCYSAQIVLNLDSGVHHKVANNSGSSENSAGKAACGWRFGRVAHAILPEDVSLPQMHKCICGKCYPAVHAAAKWRLGRICQ